MQQQRESERTVDLDEPQSLLLAIGRPSLLLDFLPAFSLRNFLFLFIPIARDPFTFKEMVKPGQIYKTNAMAEFGLSEEDLSHLVAITTNNPNPRSKRRYQLDEVKILAKVVHGDLDTYNENRKAKAEERLAKKRQRQRERVARWDVLEEALRGSGLSIYSNGNHNLCLCRSYIRYGIGDPNQIANVTKERRFFKRSTRYSEIYRNSRVALAQYESYESHWKYQYSTNAQNQALEEWARAFPSREAALADPNLPESLKDRVRQIEMNE